MHNRIGIVGLDPPEFTAIAERLEVPVVAHETLPRILVRDGELRVESREGPRMLPVSGIIFHGIFEDDLDFIAALALWGGPCLPSAQGMMDCRLKLPCLARALRYTRFGSPARGYASPGVAYATEVERVAKWGNWHCGENKARFRDSWTADEPCIIEPFLPGRAVRILLIGDRHWQIGLEGDGWLKSIHDAKADFMDVDEDLLADAREVRRGFGLEILANDYIVAEDGAKHLLEVNHIPNVTRFPEVWEAYRDFAVDWVNSG